MADDKIEVGDKVSWNWNGNHPDGKVAEVKEGEVSVTSHRGNEIKKTGDVDDPAVHIARSGNDVVKKASELDVEEKADESGKSQGDKENGEHNPSPPVEDKAPNGDAVKEGDKAEENGEENGDKNDEKNDEETESKETGGDKEEPKVGDKRKADDKVDGDAQDKKADEQNGDAEEKDDDTAHAKKQKTTNGAVKKPGRPKKSETADANKKPPAKKEKKEPARGQSQRKTRSQGSV